MPTRPPTDDDAKTTPFIRDEGSEEPGAATAPGAAPATPAAELAATAPATAAAAPAPLGDPYRTPAPLDLQHRGGVVGGSFSRARAGQKMPPWAIPLIGSVVLVHVVFLGVSWASSIWAIERLDRPKDGIADIALAPPPPPPPPPPPGGAKPKTQTITPKVRTVKDIVQPVKIEKQETKPEESGDPNGEEGGEEGGEVGGVVGGQIGGVISEAPPPPPPPPPPAPPQTVAPNALEQQRIAGNAQILPATVTQTQIQRSGKTKIIGTFKICISAGGAVTAISKLRSTGFAAYDSKIQSEMHRWRYRPFMVNGKAVPVCTAVTFVYTQH